MQLKISSSILNYVNNFLTDNRIWPQITACIILLSTSDFASAHGTVTSPPSRIWNCYQENPESPSSAACIAAVASHGAQPLYDWSEINQGEVNGLHTEYILNGNLASGGRPDKYGGMDQVRSDWVATPVSPGAFTVTWTNSAPHATAYYDVYITKENWTPELPLTWNNLELLTQTSASSASELVNIPVNLPNRTGKHVIYSIWQRSDSPEAFYATSDVDFGMITTSIKDIGLSSQINLHQNFPNPFNSSTQIRYTLNTEERVILKVYDVYGKELDVLVNKQHPSGEHTVTFNANYLHSGVYYYVLQAGDVKKTKIMILNK